MITKLILLALCPACPIVTKYIILKRIPALNALSPERKTRIHKLSFIGSAVCIGLFLWKCLA